MADDVIVLTGIKETLDALKEFDKGAVRRFNKVINTELANAERDAKGLISEKRTDEWMARGRCCQRPHSRWCWLAWMERWRN